MNSSGFFAESEKNAVYCAPNSITKWNIDVRITYTKYNHTIYLLHMDARTFRYSKNRYLFIFYWLAATRAQHYELH